MLHQVGNLFELNVKLRCQKVNQNPLGHVYIDFREVRKSRKFFILLEIVMEEFVRYEVRDGMSDVKGSIRSFTQKLTQYNICSWVGEGADI